MTLIEVKGFNAKLEARRRCQIWAKTIKAQKNSEFSPKHGSAKKEISKRRSWVRRLNLDRQDDLKQLDFRRSINRNSLEGIEVAKLFYKVSLKILSTQA
ncbi:hypothetical protein QL285_016373 [Trifolium repens]|nr:hypothetical protein QL285_016373 [Trifolium repens]